jgi:hypothetical protein
MIIGIQDCVLWVSTGNKMGLNWDDLILSSRLLHLVWSVADVRAGSGCNSGHLLQFHLRSVAQDSTGDSKSNTTKINTVLNN